MEIDNKKKMLLLITWVLVTSILTCYNLAHRYIHIHVNHAVNIMSSGWESLDINNNRHRSPPFLKYCDPPKLDGAIKVELNVSVATKFPDSLLKTINKGGWWKPPHCKARKEVAILIPFRQRDVQLKMFLYHIHPFLQKQLLAYRIFVLDHQLGEDFNRGCMLNVGFLNARNFSDFDCYIFHDVDYLPEHDGNDYGCVTSPRHLAVCNDWTKYKPRDKFMGGVFSTGRSAFERVNGFSNLYFGWGAEDDDLAYRYQDLRYKLHRASCETARYTTIKYNHYRSSTPMVGRTPLRIGAVSRMRVDGLNSIKYNMKEVKEEDLYTHMRIECKKSSYKYPKCVFNKCTYS